jgi:hypothetical protein
VSNLSFLLLIFLGLIFIEAVFNYLSGLWSVFWFIPEVIFDLIFLGFIGFVAMTSSNSDKKTVRN